MVNFPLNKLGKMRTVGSLSYRRTWGGGGDKLSPDAIITGKWIPMHHDRVEDN